MNPWHTLSFLVGKISTLHSKTTAEHNTAATLRPEGLRSCSRLPPSLPDQTSPVAVCPVGKFPVRSPSNASSQVDSTYEVTGAGGGGKVFAIGDCTNLPIPKVVYLALLAGQAMVKQVAASAAGNPLKELAPKNPVAFSFVPVGKSGGVSALPVMGVVVGDFMTRNIKSKDMFCAKYWAELNAGKPPVVL